MSNVYVFYIRVSARSAILLPICSSVIFKKMNFFQLDE